jgi:hypothetical protein
MEHTIHLFAHPSDRATIAKDFHRYGYYLEEKYNNVLPAYLAMNLELCFPFKLCITFKYLIFAEREILVTIFPHIAPFHSSSCSF